jgi:CRP-like cAMP-binding protein
VRGSSFCGTLIDGSPSSPPSEQSHISQIFMSAGKDDVILHDGHGGKEGSGPMVLCEGWAYRFHRFADGRRQILSVLIPGDLFSVSALLDRQPEFPVQAATDIKYCQLGRDDIKRKLAAESGLCDAFGKLCAAETDESTSTVIGLNERDAARRVLGFVQRLVKRLSARGITVGSGVYQFPLCHADIADATGLIPGDVGHALKNLREHGILDMSDNELTILNSAEFEKHATILGS